MATRETGSMSIRTPATRTSPSPSGGGFGGERDRQGVFNSFFLRGRLFKESSATWKCAQATRVLKPPLECSTGTGQLLSAVVEHSSPWIPSSNIKQPARCPGPCGTVWVLRVGAPCGCSVWVSRGGSVLRRASPSELRVPNGSWLYALACNSSSHSRSRGIYMCI